MAGSEDARSFLDLPEVLQQAVLFSVSAHDLAAVARTSRPLRQLVSGCPASVWEAAARLERSDAVQLAMLVTVYEQSAKPYAAHSQTCCLLARSQAHLQRSLFRVAVYLFWY